MRAEHGIPSRVEVRELRLLPDDRGGFLKVLMRGHLPEPAQFGEIYLTSARRGATKGRHFHELTHEWFCVIRGASRLWLQDVRPTPGAVHVLELTADRPRVVHVPPGVAHAFENPGDEPMVVLAYADRPYDPAATDTVPFVIGQADRPQQ